MIRYAPFYVRLAAHVANCAKMLISCKANPPCQYYAPHVDYCYFCRIGRRNVEFSNCRITRDLVQFKYYNLEDNIKRRIINNVDILT